MKGTREPRDQTAIKVAQSRDVTPALTENERKGRGNDSRFFQSGWHRGFPVPRGLEPAFFMPFSGIIEGNHDTEVVYGSL
jgi:hypothetical protein